MKSPSVKSLLASFDIAREQALLVKELCAVAGERFMLAALIEAKCPETHAYARSCYSDPYSSQMWRRTMVLHAIDQIVGTCGVEGLGPGDAFNGYAPPYEYLNAGDPYTTTLIYKRDTDNLYLGAWGPIAERHSDW